MKITIRSKITIIMLILIIISVSTLGFLTYNDSKEIMINQIKLNNYKTLQNVNDYFLKNFMYDMEYIVNHWASKDELKNYRNQPDQPKMVVSIPKHFKPTSDKWTGYVTSNPDVAWIYLGVEEDGSLFVTPIDPTMPKDYDCRTREWYKAAIKNKDNLIWTEPYIDAGDLGNIIVTVAKTVNKNDRLVGVVGMDIKLKKFSKIINDIQFGENGYLMLLSKNGDIYAHPDNKMLTKNISHEKWVKKILSNEEGSSIHIWNNKKVVVSYLTVPNTQWKLVGVNPININKEVAPIKNKFIAIGIFSILITFIIGYFLSLIITNPVSNMMKVINEVSIHNNLNIHVKINSNDEFKILGENFNDMIDKVRELLKERNVHVQELLKKNTEILSQKEEILAYSEETEAMNEELFNLLDEIRKNYLSTVKVLANSIEANDKYTRGHCDRVRNFSIGIAKELNMSQTKINVLEFASILHDIGKIGIPSSILNKEGKLTNEEFKFIQQHPQIGYDILKDVDFLEESRNILLQHHERIDGKGYPHQLKGDEIHILAKILIVADAYDAMTSARPYRKEPLTTEQAITQLKLGCGTQFDKTVVDAFLELLVKNNLSS
ncbi:HD domain-containing phosphohydrolase [Crassaminicella profunda]|uniref:HD domain-containing phosphohydrolase n=1 Tax=Crassaminicella profunda TaxID=1286698 RepID=UPI001CA6100F|nr:HD domain-containing phosphohydrolase [Crassaminicella profunda]QZY53694.1 HD domain-containing protein [Crassaminicella profunda]